MKLIVKTGEVRKDKRVLNRSISLLYLFPR